MANPRRILLWSWAALSLLVLAYMGLFFFFSEDAPANLQDMRHGNATDFPTWTRIFAVPPGLAGEVYTHTTPDPDQEAWLLGEPGDVVLATAEGVPSPFLTRLLAWAAPNATTTTTWDVPALGAYNVTNVTFTNVGTFRPDSGAWEKDNLTVNLTPFARAPGYLVKGDRLAEAMVAHQGAHPLATPVALEAIQKEVVVFQDGWSELLKLVVSALFAAIPIASLILTQRARPAPTGFDVQTAIAGHRCHECGTLTPKDAGFCYRCGATRSK